MAKMLSTPDFKSEKEEADWWFGNQDLILKEFEEAAADGSLIRNGFAGALTSAPTLTVSSEPEHKPNSAA